jgi:hypothetical protein
LTSVDVSFTAQLNAADFNVSTANKVRHFIEGSRRIYGNILERSIEDKDNKLLELKSEYGGIEQLLQFKDKYYNFSLEDIMLSRKETIKIFEYNNQLIRKDEPIYKLPEHRFGRAHFFSAEKRIFNLYMETYWFNLLILMLMVICFYGLLISNALVFIFEVISIRKLKSIFNIIIIHLKRASKPILKKS